MCIKSKADSFAWVASCPHDASRAGPIRSISTYKEYKTACCVFLQFRYVCACGWSQGIAASLFSARAVGWSLMAPMDSWQCRCIEITSAQQDSLSSGVECMLSWPVIVTLSPDKAMSSSQQSPDGFAYTQSTNMLNLGVYCKCTAFLNWCKLVKLWQMQQANLHLVCGQEVDVSVVCLQGIRLTEAQSAMRHLEI